MMSKLSLSCVLIISFLCGCDSNLSNQKQESVSDTTLDIREIAGTMNLHPLYGVDELSGILGTYIFQTLTSIDFKTLELTPLLADSLPKVEPLGNGLTNYQFTIRDEARWDNGEEIKASDVEFSIKINLLPDKSNTGFNEFYQSIVDFKVDSSDDKTLTMTSTMNFSEAKYLVGDIIILPQYLYDPNLLLTNYTIPYLNNNGLLIASDSTILNFIATLNDSKFKSNPEFIKGSGPYHIKELLEGQKITLEKKQTWWGDLIRNSNTEFEANVDIIKYHIIPDETTALSALKNGSIDLMRGISPKEFSEMKESDVYDNRLNFVTSPMMAYYSLGLNLNHPILKTKNNRKALAHLLDVQKMIDIVAYGYAEQTIGPNAKSDKHNYNFDLQPYIYSVEKAASLLKEEGWEDKDGDGVMEKVIEGINIPFELEYNYNSGNETRKKIGLIFQEDAKKAGIKIKIQPLEWSNYLDQLNNKNFEIAFVGKMFSPTPRNHKSIFHSESITEGANYTSYSNPEVDLLIDLINNSSTIKDRSTHNYKLQEILHEELPYLYLYSPLERMAINKEYSNYNLSAMRPGFWAPGFKLKK